MTVTYTTNYRLAKHDFNDSTWHDEVNGNFDDIDDILASIAGFTGATVWKNSTAYIVGNKAVDPDLNSIWQCLVAHTSSASPSLFAAYRASNPTHWSLFSSSWSSIELANSLNFTDLAVSGTLTANTPYRLTAALTATLPVLSAGQAQIIARDLASGTITVARNGQTIDGLSSDFTMDVDKDIYIFIRTAANTLVTRKLGTLPTANATASVAYPQRVLGLIDGGRKTASFSADSDTSYQVVPASNTTITLPASPAQGDVICLALFYSASGYTITINPNGKKINGSTSNLSLGVAVMTIFLVYDATAGDWT